MTAAKNTAVGNNFVSEWFGHRVYPVTAATPESLADQRDLRCPFLTEATGKQHSCVKSKQSEGVCTISSTSNGSVQDWLVCPYRALDRELLENAVRRLFGHASAQDEVIVAAELLKSPDRADGFRQDVLAGKRCFVYFQNKLGGEINLSPTERSPQFKFDSTMVEVLPDEDGITVGRYGIFEIQTMDFHGTYGAAVKNLKDSLRLHKLEFPDEVRKHREWLGEGIEGPNIANVFKRTFYQMMFKFQVGSHDQCAGCVFTIPRAVWDSWQRHLGKPDLVEQSDGTWRLGVPGQEVDESPGAWIYVFDIEASDEISPNKIKLWRAIGTSAAALSHYALDVAPAAALEAGGSVDRLLDSIRRRLSEYLPEFRTKTTPAPESP